MSYSPEPQSPRFSEKLTSAKIKKLSSLILRSEHPHTSDVVIGPLLELVSEHIQVLYVPQPAAPSLTRVVKFCANWLHTDLIEFFISQYEFIILLSVFIFVVGGRAV